MLKNLVPKYYVKRVFDIKPKWLKNIGIFGILLDLDNTLVPHNDPNPTDEVISWLKLLSDEQISVAIVSNNSRQRVTGFCRDFRIPIIWNGKKPLPNGFKRGAAAIGLKPSQIAVIGDQIFTDVIGGNLAGMTSILVQPIQPEQGLFFRLKRKLERPIMREYYKRHKGGSIK